MPSFQITDAPSRLELGNPDAGGLTPPGKATFLVRNMGPSAQVGRISVEPLEGARAEWFEITGAPATSPARIERDFVYGGNASVEVTVRPPAGAAAGNFGFRLRVASEKDPDTDFIQGPSVAFTLKPAPVVAAPAPKRVPWWVFAAGAAMVAVLGGVGAFLYLNQPGGTPVPEGLVGQPAEIAAGRVAQLPRSVKFTLARKGSGAALAVLSSTPGAGKAVATDGVVDLTVRTPDGACGSLICLFPNAEFPPEVVVALTAEGFDAKYAPALTVPDGRVKLDSARMAEIRNAQPPQPMVPLPRLGGLTVPQVQQTLSDLGLGLELASVADGPEDGLVRRTEPEGPTQLAAGSIVKVFYRPKPCVGVRCFIFRDVVIAPNVLQHYKLQPLNQ